jgi:hypothetical protein
LFPSETGRKRSFKRSGRRWKDNIKTDVKEVGSEDVE